MKAKVLRSFRKWLTRVFSAQNTLPCVGVVVFAGCVTFLIAPDELPSFKLDPGSNEPKLPMIIVDAGHGGNDIGGRGHGLIEKELTLDVAQRTERLLKVAGFPVTMTRKDDSYVSLRERARIANQFDDALFVSIHFNKDRVSQSHGIETFFAKRKMPVGPDWTWVGFFNEPEQPSADACEELAGAVQASMSSRTESRNRGIRASNLYVVRFTRCPAILIEGGFMSNAMDAQMLKNEHYRERLAMGIAEGVMAYQKARARPGSGEQPRLARLNR